jgi:hypothetical protein
MHKRSDFQKQKKEKTKNSKEVFEVKIVKKKTDS